MTARRTVGHMLDYHNQARKPRSNPAKGRCWHQSVSPTLVLARLGNATASLPLRGQPRRKALRCSYPFCQRRCAATAAQSGRTKGSYPAGQVRRKEKHPHSTQHHSRPYDITRCRRSVSINVSTDVSEKSLNARYHRAVPAWRESIPGFHERQSSNSGDTAPAQTNGDGLFGMWFLATPNLSVQDGGSTSGGYGY